MFVEEYPVERLKGAEYNPRRITSESFDALVESIVKVGFVKPVLVTGKGTLVAGHQRTKAARKLGLLAVPAYEIRTLPLGEEMRFNQLHNGADVDAEAEARVPASTAEGFVDIKPDDIVCRWDDPGAPRRNEIYQLIAKHGPWGSCVATQSGEVLSSQQYAITCKLADRPLRVFYVPDEKRELVLHYFGQEYGEFHYGDLPRNTWVQTYAQLWRGGVDDASSSLYERVLETLRKGERLLDFGCGLGQVVAKLRMEGYSAHGVEFFYKGEGTDTIKPHAVHGMIDELCRELRSNGPFDVVVADSVLNSVDSVQAESDVLTCVNALCRPGGKVYFSGMSTSHVDHARYRTARAAQPKRDVQFVDKDGFSAMPRGDKWFFREPHAALRVRTVKRADSSEARCSPRTSPRAFITSERPSRSSSSSSSISRPSRSSA